MVKAGELWKQLSDEDKAQYAQIFKGSRGRKPLTRRLRRTAKKKGVREVSFKQRKRARCPSSACSSSGCSNRVWKKSRGGEWTEVKLVCSRCGHRMGERRSRNSRGKYWDAKYFDVLGDILTRPSFSDFSDSDVHSFRHRPRSFGEDDDSYS